MPRVATFCPRCGESIETDVPAEARQVGRAELGCPSCKFRFMIAPAQGTPPMEAPPPQEPEAAAPAGKEDSDDETALGEREESQRDTAPAPPVVPRATGARPAPRGPSGALPARLLAAGFLLIFAAALGFFIGSLFVFGDLVDDAVSGTGETGLEGIVLGPGGGGVEGVEVALLERAEGRPDRDTPEVNRTTTDGEGRFRFQDVEAGSHWVRVEAEDHRTAIVELIAFADDGAGVGNPSLVNVVELEAGDPDAVEYHSVVDTFQVVASVVGWVILVLSVAALAAAALTFMRRGFGLAVTGAILGIFSIGFLVGSAMALIALVILLFSRREFRPLRTKRGPKAAPP